MLGLDPVAVVLLIALAEVSWVYYLVNKKGPERTRGLMREEIPVLMRDLLPVALKDALSQSLTASDKGSLLVAMREEKKQARGLQLAHNRAQILAFLTDKWGATQAGATLIGLEKLGILNEQILLGPLDSAISLIGPYVEKASSHVKRQIKLPDEPNSGNPYL